MVNRKAVVYCRISQDREGAGLGVERQRKDCEALARKLSWPIVATYTDNDMSAYSGKPRPGYRSLLADLEAGRANAVIVWHTDRLHRSPRELEEYVDICERHKVVTQTVKAGELDLATPSGRAVARTLGAWARFEVEHKSERTKRAQLQAAQAGRWLGGAQPLGWNVREDGSATLDRAAARRIRKATADVLAGVSLGSIVKAWNEAGFTTGTGKPWNYTSLRQVLTRARNAGLIEYNGDIVGQSPWPVIVTEDVWRALCVMLADPGRRRSVSNRAKWLLAGIAVCGKDGCGAPLRSATAGSGKADGKSRTVYRCPERGQGHVARSAVDVNAFVCGIVEAYFARESVGELLITANHAPDVGELRSEAVALRRRLRDYQGQAAEMDAVDYAGATRTLRERLGAVEGEIAAATRSSALAGIVDAPDPVLAWRKASLDRQRAIVREMFTVTILPGLRGRVFDPNLVRVVRKSRPGRHAD